MLWIQCYFSGNYSILVHPSIQLSLPTTNAPALNCVNKKQQLNWYAAVISGEKVLPRRVHTSVGESLRRVELIHSYFAFYSDDTAHLFQIKYNWRTPGLDTWDWCGSENAKFCLVMIFRSSFAELLAIDSVQMRKYVAKQKEKERQIDFDVDEESISG